MGTIGSLMPVGNPAEIVEYEIRQQIIERRHLSHT